MTTNNLVTVTPEQLQAAVAAAVSAVLGMTEPAKVPNTAPVKKAAKAGKKAAPKATPKVEVGKVSKTHLRAALSAHKAAGDLPYGLTVAEALNTGVMLADGSLPGGVSPVREVTTPKKATAKAPKKTAAKKTTKAKAKKAPAKKTTTSWPKSAAHYLRQSGLWVQIGRANSLEGWMSLASYVHTNRNRDMVAFRTSGLTPEQAVVRIVDTLRNEGMTIKHYSESKTVQKIRAQKAAAYGHDNA